jgi:tetratricopeptide (TPR) repeat protein
MSSSHNDLASETSISIFEENAPNAAAAWKLLGQFNAENNNNVELLHEAKRMAEISLASGENSEEARLILCDAARMLGENWRKVESMYQALLAQSPAFARARLGLGLLYLTWNPDKAVPQFSMGEKLAPNDASHSLNLARAYIKLHQSGLAAVALNRARQKEPRHSDIAVLDAEITRQGWASLT